MNVLKLPSKYYNDKSGYLKISSKGYDDKGGLVRMRTLH